MTETKGKKALSLCILRVLEQYASKEAPLTTRQIIGLLQEQYGMVAERKAVGRNLLLLPEMGFGLSTYQENGKGYYLTASIGAEPKQASENDAVLLDALLRAPLSTEAAERIAALQDDVPIHAVRDTAQTLSEELLGTLSLLKDAIRDKKQVSFRYNTVSQTGRRVAMREAPFVVSPYALFLANGQYYVIVAMQGYGRLMHYRLDLMDQPEKLDTPSRDERELSECADGLDVVGYVNRVIYQREAEESCTLLCARHLCGELLDTFGPDAVLSADGDMVRVEVRAPWVNVRRFLMNNLRHATLLAPAHRRANLKEELSSALALYHA